jgi:hypothetical protein
VASAGYSGKPLATKLGLKPGMRVAVIDAPLPYEALLGEVPPGLEIVPALEPGLEAVHAFFRERSALESAFPELKAALRPDGMLWVSWPKRSSPLAGDVSEDVVRSVALEGGLVDVKVAAVDADWSGLKLVYRLADR